jgi:hypothetical protein
MLNALVPGPLRDRLTRRLQDLRQDCLADVRSLANYTMHHRVVPESSEARVTSARTFLPIPDRVEGPIDTIGQLSYTEGRDALTHATNVCSQVADYVDALVDELEQEMLRIRPDLRRESPVADASA